MKALISNLLFALGLSVITTASQADDIAVIVNPGAGVEKLTYSETRQLFLGKLKTLPNQQTAAPFMHREENAVRVNFDRVVLERDPRQSRAYWAQMIFTGRGKPPRQMQDDTAIKQQVASNPNAIGYIDKKSVDASVKVVLLIPL